MLRRERPESSRRFLELALAAHAVSAACLVPGHHHVHKPLEEVFLIRVSGPPGVLERLVRGEVLALARKIEASLEVRFRL